MLTSIPTSLLKPGAVLCAPVHDHQLNTKLLASGVPITEELLHGLRRRGIHTVSVEQDDVARLSLYQPQGTIRIAPPQRAGFRSTYETNLSRELDRTTENAAELRLKKSSDPFAERILQHESCPYDAELVVRCGAFHQQSLEFLDGLYCSLVDAGASRAKPAFERLESTCLQALTQAAEDMDLFLCLGANPYALGYPHRHSLHVAMVAMGVGAALQLDRRTLVELGIGCLLHDTGMLRLGSEIYLAERILEPAEFRDIAKHPVLTFELLEDSLDRVPVGARMVAYQMHERCDGSGYPRGRTSEQIHELAKIAAVADTFVALVSPRPHRRGVLAYFALEKILHGVRDGLFDSRAARGLIESVSLFPIGSYVATSDNRVGRVVRSGRENFDRPVIELWGRRGLDKPPSLVDLAYEPDIKIARPLARLR
ncbi:MAG: HD domain-containing phosphohydrolase [Pirellulaceae bacterium]